MRQPQPVTSAAPTLTLPARELSVTTPLLQILGCPAYDAADELALLMLQQLLVPLQYRTAIISAEMLTGEVLSVVGQHIRLICVAALPPGALAPVRYLCKRLRARFPDCRIAVGLWGLRKTFAPRLEEEAHHHARHGLAALWIGGIHGLAGSAHILGLFPALALPSRASSLAYMGGFGLGAIVAMVAFASALGLAAARLAAFGHRGYQALLGGASAASIVLGGFWLIS